MDNRRTFPRVERVTYLDSATRGKAIGRYRLWNMEATRQVGFDAEQVLAWIHTVDTLMHEDIATRVTHVLANAVSIFAPYHVLIGHIASEKVTVDAVPMITTLIGDLKFLEAEMAAGSVFLRDRPRSAGALLTEARDLFRNAAQWMTGSMRAIAMKDATLPPKSADDPVIRAMLAIGREQSATRHFRATTRSCCYAVLAWAQENQPLEPSDVALAPMDVVLRYQRDVADHGFSDLERALVEQSYAAAAEVLRSPFTTPDTAAMFLGHGVMLTAIGGDWDGGRMLVHLLHDMHARGATRVGRDAVTQFRALDAKFSV